MAAARARAAVNACTFGPAGAWAISGGDDGRLRLWDTRSLQSNPSAAHRDIACVDLDEAVWSVAVSRDGARVAVGDAAGVIHVADNFVADPGASDERRGE